MKNQNLNQIRQGTQSTDSQHANVGFSNFIDTNNNQGNNSNEKHQQKKWTREDHKNVLHCFFSTILQGLGKEWQEFEQNPQDLIPPAKDTPTKLEWYYWKAGFLTFEIQEICEQINHKDDTPTRIQTLNTEKKEIPTRIETLYTDSFRKKRKDATKEQEEEVTALISTSLRRAKRGGKCSHSVDWQQNAL